MGICRIFVSTSLAQKGEHAFKVTKVKGHATEEMVSKGAVRQIDKEGNDRADYIAAEGVTLFGKETIQTGALLTKRHIGYAKFVEWLHTSFIEAIVKRNQKVSEKQIKENPKDIKGEVRKGCYVKAKIPTLADGNQQKTLGKMISVNKFKHIMEKNEKAVGVQRLL